MTTLQVINYIARYAIKYPNYTNVVICGNDDVTILQAIADLTLYNANIDWQIDTNTCKDTILVY